MNMEEIYTLALNEFRNRRSNAMIEAESNRIIALKNEEYKNACNKIGELTIDLAKAIVKKEDTSKLEKELHNAELKEVEILKKMNMSKADLEPKFVCNICKDKGIVNNSYCSCFNNLIAELSNKYNMNTFKDVSFDDCKDIDKKIKEKVLKVVEKYPEEKKYINLYFTGDVGTGKTVLTQAIANKLIEKKLFVIFTSATSLNNNFLEFHKCFEDDKDNFLRPFLESDALIIDDLGTEPLLKNVTQEYLLSVISDRILNKRLTIISTNLTNQQFIQRYGERLFSRLFDKNISITFPMSGKDLRMPRNDKKN